MKIYNYTNKHQMHNNMHMFWEKTDNGSKQGATDELTLRSLICSEAILAGILSCSGTSSSFLPPLQIYMLKLNPLSNAFAANECNALHSLAAKAMQLRG